MLHSHLDLLADAIRRIGPISREVPRILLESLTPVSPPVTMPGISCESRQPSLWNGKKGRVSETQAGRACRSVHAEPGACAERRDKAIRYLIYALIHCNVAACRVTLPLRHIGPITRRSFTRLALRRQLLQGQVTI